MLERSIARWVRADAAVLLVITLWAVTTTNSSWIWFLALFLNVVGYGLKLPSGFEHTVYGPIGQARARVSATKPAAG